MENIQTLTAMMLMQLRQWSKQTLEESSSVQRVLVVTLMILSVLFMIQLSKVMVVVAITAKLAQIHVENC